MVIQKLKRSHRNRSLINCVLKNFAKFMGKHLTHILFKKQTLAQVFSYEFCKIFMNTFFKEHLRATASVNKQALKQNNSFLLSNSFT